MEPEYRASTPENAGNLLAEYLRHKMGQGKKVLWFISGGSSIPIARKAVQILGEQVDSHLRILLVDEKFTDKDQTVTNWSQLTEGSEALSRLIPRILHEGQGIEDSLDLFQEVIEKDMEWADWTIGQFGIGEGFHTGGIENHSPAITDEALASYYKRDGYGHLTVTTKLISLLDLTFVNSFGESKKALVEHFAQSEASVEDEPTQALKSARKLVVATDVAV